MTRIAVPVVRSRARGDFGAARSSTNEFHAPHSMQLPIHLGDCAPHSWQTKTTFGWFHDSARPRRLPVRGVPNHSYLRISLTPEFVLEY